MIGKLQIGFLVSGGLGYSTLKSLKDKIKPAFVFTDKKSVQIQEYCLERNIPIFIGNPRGGKSVEFLENKNIDILLSINYLFLVESDLLSKAKYYSINFHGSLLPKYRGRTPHVWAIINGEQKVGVTAHLMVDECDAGDILLQKEILVGNDDTGNDILDKYSKLYPEMIMEIVQSLSNRTYSLTPQIQEQASLFGRRTPDDGRGVWDWHKERITNWIRAQAYPYPGAFCYYHDQKVIIDKVRITDMGFHYGIDNGTILSIQPEILVKVPNGVLAVETIRNSSRYKFAKGDKFE
jgi:methionyl-tRNA formyltransferase